MFMKAKVYRQDGKVKGEIELPASVFAAEIKGHLLYQVIKGYLANQRQGTSKTKGRSEVSGGGRKPWRQKGTGRARAGSNTSPVWARGGKAHGPDPRDYTTHLPKAMRKQALASALSSRAKDGKIIVVDAISCDPAKTKTMAGLLAALSLCGSRNLIVVESNAGSIYRAGRNIPDLNIKPLSEITAVDVLNSENIIFHGEKLIGKLSGAGRT
jgi:large subunit ribosomal protein L4